LHTLSPSSLAASTRRRHALNKLASEGMRLLNFSVAQCTSSRAALMTGRSITSTSSLPAIVSKGQSIGLNFAKKF